MFGHEVCEWTTSSSERARGSVVARGTSERRLKLSDDIIKDDISDG